MNKGKAGNLVAVHALSLAFLCFATHSAGAVDQAVRDYLEGSWLIGEKPDKGSCIAHAYKGTQLEFEFRKSGGRVMQFEPPDLFTAVSMPQIDKDGDILSIQGEGRDGKRVPILHLRLLPPDRVELLRRNSGGSQIAYRCGAPDLSVNGSVSMDALAKLAPALTGSLGLIEAVPGISDAELCQGHVPDDVKLRQRRWLQFELLGPAHYWIIGEGFGDYRNMTYDFVRRAQSTPGGLKLSMQEHIDAGEGWDVPASRGKIYELTIIEHGARLEIPELSATFVRCEPTDPVGLGIHRY